MLDKFSVLDQLLKWLALTRSLLLIRYICQNPNLLLHRHHQRNKLFSKVQRQNQSRAKFAPSQLLKKTSWTLFLRLKIKAKALNFWWATFPRNCWKIHSYLKRNRSTLTAILTWTVKCISDPLFSTLSKKASGNATYVCSTTKVLSTLTSSTSSIKKNLKASSRWLVKQLLKTLPTWHWSKCGRPKSVVPWLT